MSLFKRKKEVRQYDHSTKKPVIRASICTGERTACLKELHTGRLEDVMLIRNDADLEEFRRLYGIEGDIETVY